ncbi:thiamine/thiamine pyrophosphate ABC transporter permease ThiP [Profundibacter amoris]|uniref:Thiamine/thiamine pyrophosphate ABC transporter permease ThiP n=1 Tax=Profundibacter amoris TaxID=2171755 RepID=A0A347UCR7_9RHOB|nr:thiamine/thiamine pyrophosphate ABC transporter permease ThiP [Profundibacter amoris]AXX96645.1 thiamine/thiamine pyrophosphate ABC transporter permease ThiP [Profundibacter amoris]
MADRAFKITPLIRAGFGAVLLLLALIIVPLAALLWRAETPAALGAADWAAVRFTLLQAAISAGISVGLAVPVARALARRRFVGRGLLITLLGAPFILPVIVAVLGLLAVFGRSGILSTMLGWIGLPPVHIYGLHGVVLAHVFFNLPLATRLILQGWLAIPAERFRLAASLGFGSRDVARVLEYPMLRSTLPGAFMVIFLICMTSFAVVLALGGGPKATTVELAIYQAFRFDFDLGRAALLAGLQFTLGAIAAGVMLRVSVPSTMGGGLDRTVERWDVSAGWRDALLLGAVALFLIVPLGMILMDGLPYVFSLPTSVYQAAGRSLAVAMVSMVISTGLALLLALLVVRLRRGALLVESIGYITLAASPLVIGAGLFIVLFPLTDPVALALPVTALVNAVMSLPFALRTLVPAVRDVEGTYGRLADSLAMTGWVRMRLVMWPRLRRPLGFSAGLAAALSMGDLGVIALFSDPNGATLPLQMYRLMAAYRMDQAAGAAVLLLGMSLLLFWVFDRGGRADADV